MSHLKKVFEHLMMHSPEMALERFEEVSYLIKSGMDPNLFFKVEDIRSYKAVAAGYASYSDAMRPAFAVGEPDDEGNIPQPDPISTQVQDLMAESRVYQWAGIGFGEQETYRLQKSIKKLAAAKPHKSIRFFGKIYGISKDYYIVECTGDVAEEEGEEPPAGEGGEEEADPKLEPKGTGVNELTYYVTQDSLSDWKRLPDLSYKDLLAAREIKVLFTGDLERPIFTNPFFFGKEKHFLRAQLSRIAHATSIQPLGVAKLEEDEAADRGFTVVPNEGEEDKPFVMPTTKMMSKSGMWVHSKVNILYNGRTAHLPPEDPGNLPEGEEFDPEEAKKQLEREDPYEKLLKPISEDAAISTGQKAKQACWSVRLCGDPTEYRNENPAVTAPVSNAVVVVRSLVWPGAFSFFYGGKVQQVYLGDGHKFCFEKRNFPVAPPRVMDDPEEYEDGPEPTPLEEPVVEEQPEEENKSGGSQSEGE